MSLDQLFWARPALGYADYRAPLTGLYHCGSGAHPGGGVTGAPGHNAARAIIADRRAAKWEMIPDFAALACRKGRDGPSGFGLFRAYEDVRAMDYTPQPDNL